MAMELARLESRSDDSLRQLAHDVSKSELFSLTPEQALMVLLTGQELGLLPMQALRGIHVFNKKTSLSADLLVGIVRRSGACESWVVVEATAERCEIHTVRKGETKVEVGVWTKADAERAGLFKKSGPWTQYPDRMLRARTQADLVRRVYPDVALGLYDADELEPEQAPAGYVQPQYAAPVAIRPQLEPAPAAFDAPAFDTAGYLARFAAATSEAEVEAIALDLANADTDDTANAVLLPAYEAAQLRVSCLSESDWTAHLAAKDVTFEVANSLFKRAAAFEAAGVLDARTALAESRLEALGVPDPGAFLNAMYSKRAA